MAQLEHDNVVELTKRCTKCLVVKTVSSFSSDTRVRNRLIAKCKDCIREWRKSNEVKNKEKRRAQSNAALAAARRKNKAIRDSGNEPAHKECTECGLVKDIFSFKINTRLARDAKCWDCAGPKRNAYLRALRKNHPEEVKSRRAEFQRKFVAKLGPLEQRARSRYYRYGLSKSAYAALVESQGNKCAICRKPLVEAGKGSVVDHNHSTGAVRGVLCNGCNTALGSFGDSQVRLLAALEYLKRSEGNV